MMSEEKAEMSTNETDLDSGFLSGEVLSASCLDGPKV